MKKEILLEIAVIIMITIPSVLAENISVSSPTFNSSYYQGDKIQIIWNGTGVDHYQICYATAETIPCSYSGNNTFYCDDYGWLVLQGSPYTSNKLNWTAPTTINKNTVRIMVEGRNASDYAIASSCSGSFSITPRPINTTNATTTTITNETTTTVQSGTIIFENITQITNVGSNITDVDVENAITRILDATRQNYTKATVDLALFKAMYDVSCMYTEERFQEFRSNYNGLSDMGKRCFTYFITENVTNSLFFSNSCPALYGNGYVAQNLLDEYLNRGLSERKCQIVQMPTYIQTAEGYQSSFASQPVCNYYPIRTPHGCLTRANALNAETEDAWNDGFWLGFGGTFLIVLFIIFILYLRASGD